MDTKKYCITRCDKNERAAFASKLRELSQLTWSDINTSHRHGLGAEIITQDSIRVTIPGCVGPKEKLLAIRFSGLKAMVGRRYGAMFRIFWIDHDFSLYDHGS